MPKKKIDSSRFPEIVPPALGVKRVVSRVGSRVAKPALKKAVSFMSSLKRSPAKKRVPIKRVPTQFSRNDIPGTSSRPVYKKRRR